MNFLDVVATGKPFRRPCYNRGFYFYFNGDFIWFKQLRIGDMTESTARSSYLPTKDDVLAQDWEIFQE